MKNTGYLVQTKSGIKGRTYHSKEPIKGKTIVYKEISPLTYSTEGILCEVKSLTIIGYID